MSYIADRRSLHLILVVGLVLGGLPATSMARAQADLNGDDEIDVLDLQRMVSDVLGSSGDVEVADLNGDGNIDVLDLQLVVVQTSDVQVPKPPEVPRPLPPGVLPVGQMSPGVVLAPARLLDSAIETMQNASPRLPRWEPARGTDRDTERYLFSLTPHAPPRLG